MRTIPGFTESQICTVTDTLKVHFKGDDEVQAIDSDIRPSPHDRELIACPWLYRQANNRNLVIFKADKRRCRARADHELKQKQAAGDGLACCYGITITRNQLKPTFI